MRHLKAGRKLGRNASHRLALMRNLSRALILSDQGRITTTVAKAKALRPFVEKLITLAKQGTLHARRLCLARLNDKESVKRLFSDLAGRYEDRPGGYTRVLKLHKRRLGDGGFTAMIELVRPGERRVKKERPAPAPAPRIVPPTPAQEPAPAPAPTPAPLRPSSRIRRRRSNSLLCLAQTKACGCRGGPLAAAGFCLRRGSCLLVAAREPRSVDEQRRGVHSSHPCCSAR